MRSTSEIIVFAVLSTSVLGLAHYYLWLRMIRDARLPRWAHLTLSILLVFLFLSLPTTLIIMRDVSQQRLLPLAYVAFTWLGLVSTYFVIFGLGDVINKVRWLVIRLTSPRSPTHQSTAAETSTSRRTALRRMLAGGVALGGTTLAAVAVAEAQGFRVVHVEIALSKLPKIFDGFKIVQVSDIHVGPTLGATFVRSIVQVANNQNPDLIAITGDLVDGSVEHLAIHTAPLRDLEAANGVVFVTGNHEYYSGADEWIEELARLGIPTLRNDAMRIKRDGDSFLLAGVTDFRAGRYGDAPDLNRALRQRLAGEEVILLAHQPRALSEAAEHDVGLQLSGHTHGGQFWPWNWVIHLIEPVVSGWAQLKRTQIYVNSGTGYWGPPMRMGTHAELTVITLRSKS